MIKRRFFRLEHADGNDASDTSSSSSDSEAEAEAEGSEETEVEDDDDVPEVREHQVSVSSSSGYESEYSSANEVEADPSDDIESANDGRVVKKSYISSKNEADILDALSKTVAEKGSTPSDNGCILKCKSVFKCRLCPRIICLTEESLNTHLKSKRHARSEKLLNDGRLKLMLNSDGEIEEDGETHAERCARTVAATQNVAGSRKKNRGRQRQRKRLTKKKKGEDSNVDKAASSTDTPAKKRHKKSQN